VCVRLGVIFREEHRFRVSEKRVMRTLFKLIEGGSSGWLEKTA
jgi:hypothetical protein